MAFQSFGSLQLVVFAVGVVYARHNHGSVKAVANTSFGLTLVVFLAVLGYHLMRRIASFRRSLYRCQGYADVEEKELSMNYERTAQ